MIVDQKPANMKSRVETPRQWRILLVVTAGGKTNATPLLEIGKILAERGHIIDFGTLEGQQVFAKGYDYVENIFTLGPSPFSKTDEETAYLRMSDWDEYGCNQAAYDTMMFLGITWPEVYTSLRSIMQDPKRRPDFLLVDYNVKAAQDMHAEFGVPFGVHWPQMPTNQLKVSYTPGITGLQYKVLTSEHATLQQRLYSEIIHPIKQIPGIISYVKWEKRMRREAGVKKSLPMPSKPAHLCLVNSFFGVEAPRDLPPNVKLIGPVLADEVETLSGEFLTFMDTHKRTIYITFGTHVLLRHKALMEIVNGAIKALDTGVVDGIIWAIRGLGRKQFNLSEQTYSRVYGSMTIANLLDNQHPNFLFTPFAPQRAILAHENCKSYVTHAGASSTMECTFHGIPTIVIPVYFDQNQNALRLRDAGVAICLDKDNMTADEFATAVATVVRDDGGRFAHASKYLAEIARIASRRKVLAADLVEETLVDWEGRQGTSKPYHLATCDTRMPSWKVKNWDLWAVVLVSLITLAVSFGQLARLISNL